MRTIVTLVLFACTFIPVHAARTFYWSMEADVPDVYAPGSDSTYRGSATRVTDQAYTGAYSLNCGEGTYNLAMFDNATSDDVWASPEEGTIRLWIRYTGTPAGMLFQITGKDITYADDTNDALKVTYHSVGRWTMTYGGGGGGVTTVVRFNDTTSPDTWIPVVAKWRTSHAPYLYLSVDGTEVAGSDTFATVLYNAWHHLLIGNDLNVDPDGLWIDDFEVYDTWVDSFGVDTSGTDTSGTDTTGADTTGTDTTGTDTTGVDTTAGADPVFYWDMETDVPNIYKTDNTVRLSADAYMSDSAAYAGEKSFRNSGAWALAMFDNPTLVDEWCPVSEGSFEFYWRYVPPWDGKMIFQITGKDVSGLEDTNDGFSVRLRGSTEGQFTAGMGWWQVSDSTWHTASIRSASIPMVDGQWYRFRVRYKVGTGISLQIDDNTPSVSTDPLGVTACTAWHHLLIGNDTYAEGIQYIDEFRVWDTWSGIDDTSSVSVRSAAEHAVPAQNVTVYPNPMQDVVFFHAADIKGFTVYDRTGKTAYHAVNTGGDAGGFPCWDGRDMAGRPVPAGIYFYRLDNGAAGMIIKK